MHKKIILIYMTLLIPIFLSAQVFNTGQTLKRGKMTLGLFPTIYSSDFYIFMDGGYGLSKGADVNFKIGAGPISYFGADYEMTLRSVSPYISLSGGMHYFGESLGLDGTLNFTYPADKAWNIYSGLDMDININGNPNIPIWLFAGAEFGYRQNITLLFEVDLGFNGAGNNIGLGLGIYL